MGVHPPDQLATFPIPKELLPLVKDLIELYSYQTQGAIAKALQELITNLKADPNFQPLPHSLPDTDLPAPTLPIAIASEEEEESDDNNNLKSWEDLLNFTVYVDTEIYSHEDRGAIAEPELSPAEVIVVTHEEATEAYMQSWSEIADKMANLPNDAFTRSWSTAEIAKIFNCSADSLRKAKSQKRLPLIIDNFLVDCIGQEHKKLLWVIRLK